MAFYIKIANTSVADPVTITTSDEILWSSNAGRSADSGRMLGDIIARKQTVEVEWAWITKAQFNAIKTQLNSDAYFSLKISFDGTADDINITCYRSELSGDFAGKIGPDIFYRSAKVQFIQQ